MPNVATKRLPDFIELENELALIMARQEASGFKLDVAKADALRIVFSKRYDFVYSSIKARYFGMPGKLKMPKVRSAKRGTQAGCPFHEIIEFNPTSRTHIAHALSNLGVTFTKTTDKGAIKIDEDILAEINENSSYSLATRKAAKHFRFLLKLQKWLGQLNNGANSWLNKVEADGCIHHSCSLATQTGRNAHRNPNLGQVISAHWARALFKPHPGHVLVGVDLEGLELRCLGHYLHPYDEGRFADIVVNGDVHQINADRVGCSRRDVKTLTYAFIYGAGDLKLGKTLYPTLPEYQQKIQGKLLRQKFLDAIPGLEPLVEAVKFRIRNDKMLIGLDGRPVFCSAEHAGLNYLLQGSGAVLSKRFVVIAYNDLIAKYTWNDDFTFTCYVHDEVQASCKPEIAHDVRDTIVAAALKAGDHYAFRIPITAAGDIGQSWQDTH